MTTIVFNFKDSEVAVDSRCTKGLTIVSDNYDKVIENKLGIWFFAGTVSDRQELCNLSPNETASHSLDGAAILIRDGAAFTVYTDEDGRYCETPLEHNSSMGSGEEFALAAMDFGLSAAEAVGYAMQRDIATGGAIQVYNLNGIIEPEISKD
jgi:ATP-dependent protease HslVU (ClpYQ) peptidase subunit